MTLDEKIHDIGVAYIRRTVESQVVIPSVEIGRLHPSLASELELEQGELALLSGWFSQDNWYAFTTRRIISKFWGDIQSLDPSRGIETDFPNFKGWDPGDQSEHWQPGKIAWGVFTIVANESRKVVRFHFRTCDGGFDVTFNAAYYWNVKHPILHKLMTTAEHEAYKKAHPRKPRPEPTPADTAKRARDLIKQYSKEVISAEELWGWFLQNATPETVPAFMSEFTAEIHEVFRAALLKPAVPNNENEKAVLDAVAKWFGIRV